MTGVEILAMEEVATAYVFNWEMYLTIVGAVTIFCTLVLGLLFFKEVGAWGIFMSFMLSMLASGIVALIPASGSLPTEYETQYKVTISDEVSMNDFLERYEIVDQEGKIYTVRERDGVEDDSRTTK